MPLLNVVILHFAINCQVLFYFFRYLFCMNGSQFIERVEKLLAEQGKTRKDIADSLGFTYQNFTDWKRRNVPSPEICLKIAKYLGVSVEYLILGEESGIDDDIAQAISILKEIPKEKRPPLMAIIKSQAEFWKKEQ